MKFTSQKRPSPAMVVAILALSLGLAGSAVAAKGGLGTAQVKTVANKQITKRAPGLAVASAKSADTAKRATNLYGANVNADGAMLGSIPPGVTSTRLSTGIYRVDFPVGVTGCMVFSAFGSNDGAISPGSTGAIPATVENPNRIAVATFNNAGAVADRDFYVQITCP
jgi:hypothetical protein